VFVRALLLLAMLPTPARMMIAEPQALHEPHPHLLSNQQKARTDAQHKTLPEAYQVLTEALPRTTALGFPQETLLVFERICVARSY
jgi:hypothetical protein